MLGKLLKHELRATARFMWVVFAAMAGMSVFARLSFSFYDESGNTAVNMLLSGLLILWIISLIAGALGTLVLLVKRFHQNLLTDEGYLMFTLPANVHQLVWSKLIAAVIWLIAMAAVELLCLMIALVHNEIISDFYAFIREIMDQMTAYYAVNFTVIALELLGIAILSCADLCLRFYSAMSIGYGFASHKVLLSVVFYFVQYAARQTLGSIILAVLVAGGLLGGLEGFSAMGGFHAVMGFALTLELIQSAAFYILTTLNLKKRLNLG